MPPISSPKSEKKPRNKKPVPGPRTKDRPVAHPEVVVAVCQGPTALTVEKAKELLGWEELADNEKGADAQLTDYGEKKVRLKHDTKNRPITESWLKTLVQEHLNKRWRLNGETIVIGRYAEVLSGQHRLISLVLAEQDRLTDPHWEENWPGPVTMDTVVVLGVDEMDEVVNTLDTGKPRSLSDVLYRSEHFADYAPKDRKTAARIGDYAIRMLWHRTGADVDAFAPKRTHAESLAFLDNHKTLAKRIVRHVLEEDRGGGVSSVLSPGYATAMVYLMAQGKTDPTKYKEKAKEGVRSEKHLDLSMLDKAEEFVLLLGQVDDDGKATSDLGKAVRAKIKELNKRENADGEAVPATVGEKMAIITFAWLAFVEGKPVKFPPKDIDLLRDPPTLGGIDLGEDHDEDEPDDVEEGEDNDPVEDKKKELEATRPDRVKTRIAEIEAEREAAKAAKKAGATTNGSMKSVADEIREQYAPMFAAHPGKTIFFLSRTSGGLTCIDEQAKAAAKILEMPATKDPSGFVRFTISKADKDTKLAKLKEAGLKIAVAEEVISGAWLKKEKSVKVTDA